mmetsp:Transcript_40953/g.47053  ORF Transcript_40953/g.47053 Transcript_40953/m.47053 type:complete len:184 (+) Transcript_40953:767-1318(+)
MNYYQHRYNPQQSYLWNQQEAYVQPNRYLPSGEYQLNEKYDKSELKENSNNSKTFPALTTNSTKAEEDPTKRMLDYCWCFFDADEYSLSLTDVKRLNEILVEKASCEFSYDENDSYLTRNSVYLKLLEGFNYRSEEETNLKTGKVQSVYRCLYNGCNKEFNRAWNLLNHANMHKGVKPYVCQM